ncbi:MAG: HPP family protein [Candidatus Omnitrophota bacterium]
MRILDQRFRHNRKKYLAQTLFGGAAVVCALLLFDVVNNPVVIASLGASAFVAFAAPHYKTAGPRYLIGGYIIGITVGVAIHNLTEIPLETYLHLKLLHVACGGLAVFLAMFLMAVTNTEHAPATGIALGLVINDWTLFTIVRIILAIIIISGIQRLFRRWMIDLI